MGRISNPTRGGRGMGRPGAPLNNNRGSRVVNLLACGIVLVEVSWRCFTIVNRAVNQDGEHSVAVSSGSVNRPCILGEEAESKEQRDDTLQKKPPRDPNLAPPKRPKRRTSTNEEEDEEEEEDDDDDDDDEVLDALLKDDDSFSWEASTSILELPALRRMDVYPVELLLGSGNDRQTFDGYQDEASPSSSSSSSEKVYFESREPPPRCITVRAPRKNITFAQLKRPLRVGIEFVENVDHFTSRAGRSGVFHFYHFVEFMVAAVTELYSTTSDSKVSRRGNRLGPAFGGPVEIPWIYSPHLAREEMMGLRGLNWLVAQITLNGCLDGSPIFHSKLMGEEVNATLKVQWDEADEEDAYEVNRAENWRSVVQWPACRFTAFRGMEANDDGIRWLYGAYNRTRDGVRQHPKARRYDRPPHDVREMNQREMVSAVDSILLIHRDACHGGAINKMWFGFLDDFPAEIWHAHIVQALQRWKRHLGETTTPAEEEEEGEETKKDRGYSVNDDDNDDAFVITYIDRQDSLRTMPLQDHEWIVETFSEWASSQPGVVVFQQVVMEELDHYQQLACAARSDVLVGVHGNGLTHQLWMPPFSAIVEIFWQYPFQYDYGTMARLLRHEYTAVMNGVVLPHTRIQELDPEMLRVPHDLNGTDGHFLQETQRHLQEFVQQALDKKRQPKTTTKTDADKTSARNKKATKNNIPRKEKEKTKNVDD